MNNPIPIQRSFPQAFFGIGRKRLYGWLKQIVAIVLLGLFAAYVIGNVQENLSLRGLNLGLDFLQQQAGFAISFSVIPYSPTDTYWRVFQVGIANTLFVTFLAMIAATVIGFVVGIAQLSSNWAASRAALVYVEVVRNLPLLLHLLFWYNVGLRALPPPRQAIHLGDVLLSNRGIYLPSVHSSSAWTVLLVVAAAVMAAVFLYRKMAAYKEAKGSSGRVWPFVVVTAVVLPAVVLYLIGVNFSIGTPALSGFNIVGGWVLVPELAALVFALSIYNAAFIAELVRGSIESVDRGQLEAARAIGFSWGKTLRLVIIPQAFRVLTPPLANQYLNLLKGTSLAVAIGYPDLISIFTGVSINQTGRAIEIVAMTMAVYLSISILIGAGCNLFDRLTRIPER